MTLALLTLDEAAARLKVSRVTVWRRVNSGALRALRDGRVIRVREDWIDDYVEAKSAPAVAAPRPSRNPKYARK